MSEYQPESKVDPVASYRYTIDWLKGEQPYQIKKFGSELGKEWIRMPLDEDNLFWKEIKSRLNRANQLKLWTVNGRQTLAKFAATTVAMAANTVVVYGELPHAGVSSGENTTNLKPFSGHDLSDGFNYVLDWLKAESEYQLGKYGTSLADKEIVSSFDEKNELWQEMTSRYWRAKAISLDFPNGRQSVAKMSALSVAIVAAAVRKYGLLPKAGVPSGCNLEDLMDTQDSK